jgi:hypothetical protein
MDRFVITLIIIIGGITGIILYQIDLEVQHIPKATITQSQAIQIVENALQERFSNSTKIMRISGGESTSLHYISFSEFMSKNESIPLVYVYPNGTLLTVNNAPELFQGKCMMVQNVLCGFLPPINLNYESRLIWIFDICYGKKDGEGSPIIYMVDATSGHIVGSSFDENPPIVFKSLT